jgi:hypothetical protein
MGRSPQCGPWSPRGELPLFTYAFNHGEPLIIGWLDMAYQKIADRFRVHIDFRCN